VNTKKTDVELDAWRQKGYAEANIDDLLAEIRKRARDPWRDDERNPAWLTNLRQIRILANRAMRLSKAI